MDYILIIIYLLALIMSSAFYCGFLLYYFIRHTQHLNDMDLVSYTIRKQELRADRNRAQSHDSDSRGHYSQQS